MLKTTTPTVDAIGRLDFTGTITPTAWYKNNLLKHRNGKLNLVALLILADIVYWYRPTIDEDEYTGEIKAIRKKFEADKLQKSYEAMANKFGITKRQVQDACYFLRDKNLITIELRNILSKTDKIPINNVTYFEPVVEMVEILSDVTKWDTFPIGYPITPERDTPYAATHDTSRQNVTYLTPERETNTKNTAENSTEITTNNIFLPDAAIAGAGTQNNSSTQDKLESTNDYTLYQNHTESNSLMDKSNSIAAKESDFLNAAPSSNLSSNGHDSSKPLLVKSHVPAQPQNFSINAGNLNTIPNGVSSFNINPSWSNISPMAAKEKISEPPPMKTSNDQFPAEIDLTHRGPESILDQKENSAKEKGKIGLEEECLASASEISPELVQNELDPINPQSGSHALQKIDPAQIARQEQALEIHINLNNLTQNKIGNMKTGDASKFSNDSVLLAHIADIPKKGNFNIYTKNIYLKRFATYKDELYKKLLYRYCLGQLSISDIQASFSAMEEERNFSIMDFLLAIPSDLYTIHSRLMDFNEIMHLGTVNDSKAEGVAASRLLGWVDNGKLTLNQIEECYYWLVQTKGQWAEGLKFVAKFFNEYKKAMLSQNPIKEFIPARPEKTEFKTKQEKEAEILKNRRENIDELALKGARNYMKNRRKAY